MTTYDSAAASDALGVNDQMRRVLILGLVGRRYIRCAAMLITPTAHREPEAGVPIDVADVRRYITVCRRRHLVVLADGQDGEDSIERSHHHLLPPGPGGGRPPTALY